MYCVTFPSQASAEQRLAVRVESVRYDAYYVRVAGYDKSSRVYGDLSVRSAARVFHGRRIG